MMRSVVLVVFGGRSTEHDISVITGVLTVNGLRGAGEDVLPVYVTPKGEWYTADFMNDVAAFQTLSARKMQRLAFLFGEDIAYYKKGKKLTPFAYVRAAVNCMHGKNGEDGVLPAILHECHIPVTSPAMTESAILMDKWYAKLVFQSLGIPVLSGIMIRKEAFYRNVEEGVSALIKKLGLPLCVKPTRLGSSIGISVAEEKEALTEAIITAFRYDGCVIIEPALKGFSEYSVAVYKKEKELVIGKPQKQIPKGAVYSFAEKYLEQGGYLSGGSCSESENAPAEEELPDATPISSLQEQMQKICKRVYEEMGLCGVVRFDFLELDERIYLNEINTVPGSMSYYFFGSDPKKAGGFFLDLIREGVHVYREEESLVKSYPSSVLTSLGGEKGRMGKR